MVIGITGGYCTGKSEVIRIFRSLGAKTIDLDKLAHSALKRGTQSHKKIIKEFGKEVLINNSISRPLLAKKVFGNKKRAAKLNSIIHPIVIKQMFSLVKKFKKGSKVICVEAPLLFEASIAKYFDYVVVVRANQKKQLTRAAKKTGLSKRDILKRINSQWSLKRKIARADFIIDNNKSTKKTRQQVKQAWRALKSDYLF